MVEKREERCKFEDSSRGEITIGKEEQTSRVSIKHTAPLFPLPPPDTICFGKGSHQQIGSIEL
jgi:hypothetical protein